MDGLTAADNIMTFKMAVKTIAKRHGLHATFMPKPKAGVNGSGMHINMSLADQSGHNVFIDETDVLGLSRVAYQFMAGILAHMKEITVLTNPLVNSYKRLVPGYTGSGTLRRWKRSVMMTISTEMESASSSGPI